MGELADRLAAALSDIDSQLIAVDREASSKRAVLLSKKAALQQASQLVTPEAELAISALKKIGVQI